MTAPKAEGEPRGEVGRPSKYDPKFIPLGFKLALLGLTDEEMADVFGVCKQTLYNWMAEYPEFLDSITQGKVPADAEIAASMFHRARGYSHPAVKIFMPAGATQPVYAEYTEHYPPDTSAAAIWLSNRRRGKWSRDPDRRPDADDADLNINVTGGLPDGED